MFLKFICRITVFLIIVTSGLFADKFYINPYYLDKLQKDSKSYKIIKDYVRFLNSVKDEDDKTKINKVNLYINRILPRYDAYNYKNEEYWATPFEFFSSAGGDCEDYVIAKMYSLKKLGFSEKIMYMSAVKEKYVGGDHMVLSLQIDKNSPPLVLDNLSMKVLPIDKRVDLKLMFMFNKNGFFKLNDYKKLINIDNKILPAYEKLRLKNKKELIIKK